MKEIPLDGLKEIIEKANNILIHNGYKWYLYEDMITEPIVNEKDKDSVIPSFISTFVVIPVKKYLASGKDQVRVSLIKEIKGRYYIEVQDMEELEYKKSEWLNPYLIEKGMAIFDRKKFKNYLSDSLCIATETNKIATDIWTVTKMNDTQLKLQLTFSGWDRIIEGSSDDIDILSVLQRHIEGTEVKSKFAVIIAYMLMAQCNLPIAYLKEPSKQWLNVVVDEDNDLLIDILHELTKCINISLPQGATQNNMIMSYYVKDEIDAVIKYKTIKDSGEVEQIKFDYALVIDNRQNNIAKIRDAFPTKEIGESELECMPVVISKERLSGRKYINIDLTGQKFSEEMLLSIRDSAKHYQYTVKSFYKTFVNELNSSGGSKKPFARIDSLMSSAKYTDLRKENYDYYLIKFFVCLEYIFKQYLEFHKSNVFIDYKYWEALAEKVFKDTLESDKAVYSKKRGKHGNEVENLLREVWELYQDNGNAEHFVNKDDYIRGAECKGFFHEPDGVMCICLTEEWLCEYLEISAKEARSRLKAVALAGEYNASFKCNDKEATGQLKVDLKNPDKPTRYFTVSVDNLKKWIEENGNRE